MDQFFRLVVYIIAANVAYLVFSLIKQGFKHYSNYIAELLFFVIILLWLLHRDIDPVWVFLAGVLGVVILVIIPIFLQSKIDSLMAENRYDEILFFAKLKASIAWSYPNSHLEDMAEIADRYAETPVKMTEKLKELLDRGEPYDGMTRLFLGLIHFNNRNFNDLINDLRIPDKSFDEHSFEELLYLIRAYLETTRYDEAVEAQIALEKKIFEKSDNKAERMTNAVINRFVFYAFMGWKDEYDSFLNSNEEGLDRLPKELRDFWRGVCYFYSGSYDEGEKQMREVVDKLPEEAFVFKEFMQKRMTGMLEHKFFFNEHVLPKLKELHEKYNKKLAGIIQSSISEDEKIIPQNKVTKALSFVILVISVIYIIVFNINDSIELINMGATSSFLVKNGGEYFRLVSYIFVHVGILHLIMNLLALRYFGPPVETVAGWPALLLVFFGSGIAGGALSVYMGNSLTVGASGGVLGLLTATIVFELFKIKGSGNFSEQSNFSTLIFILGINIAFGFFESGIDNYAHFGGLIGGAILGMLYIIPIKVPIIKKFANLFSIMFTIILLGFTLQQHISLFKSNSFYPLSVKEYQSCDVASSSIKLEIPTTWKVEDSIKPYDLTIKGPFGEKLTIGVRPNSLAPESYLKEYVEQNNIELEKENELELVSIIGPEPVSIKDNTYRVIWNLNAYGRKASLENHLIFEEGYIFVTNLIVTTVHTSNYDPIINHVVSTLKLK